MTHLCDLAVRHVTDKCVPNAYTPIYSELFKDRIDSTRLVFEIGIGKTKGTIRRHAASLKMWQEYFPNAQIVGVDIRKDLLINEGRIKSFAADQSDPGSIAAAASRAVNECGHGIDIAIDDGSHNPDHQISSAFALVPLVKFGGLYIIEDIHHERVFDEIRGQYQIERIGTNEPIGAVLGIIRC